jgi:hypothetical protein
MLFGQVALMFFSLNNTLKFPWMEAYRKNLKGDTIFYFHFAYLYVLLSTLNITT